MLPVTPLPVRAVGEDAVVSAALVEVRVAAATNVTGMAIGVENVP